MVVIFEDCAVIEGVDTPGIEVLVDWRVEWAGETPANLPLAFDASDFITEGPRLSVGLAFDTSDLIGAEARLAVGTKR